MNGVGAIWSDSNYPKTQELNLCCMTGAALAISEDSLELVCACASTWALLTDTAPWLPAVQEPTEW